MAPKLIGAKNYVIDWVFTYSVIRVIVSFTKKHPISQSRSQLFKTIESHPMGVLFACSMDQDFAEVSRKVIKLY